MRTIKTLAITLIAACTFAAVDAQIKLPPPPPAPPNPLHLGKPKLPKVHKVHKRRVTLRRPPAPRAPRPLPRPAL